MKIHSININQVTDIQLKEWFEQMDERRKVSVTRMQNDIKKKQCVCADALCRKAVSEFCGINANELHFELSPYGKPYVRNLPVFFNISHSDDYVVCAVSENEIGIDIEKIRKVHPRAHEKICTESEKDYISLTENGFFEIWTLKESYFKCKGTGLGADIKKVSFEIRDNEIICSENGFRFSFIEVDKDYICSVCEKQILDK